MKKHQRPCDRCGEPRHKNSDSGLCQSCYWAARREAPPYTDLTKSEYDAQRYHATERRDAYLQRKYGISSADFNALLTAQDGRCSICRETPGVGGNAWTHGGFVVDHATGAVRGLLCDLCNKGLGQFRDRVDLLRAAISYLGEADW